jgi:rubrerythrin
MVQGLVLSRLRQRVEARFGNGEPEQNGGRPEPRERETGSLIHTCPECGEVYLSEGPRTCSTCDRETVATQANE